MSDVSVRRRQHERKNKEEQSWGLAVEARHRLRKKSVYQKIKFRKNVCFERSVDFSHAINSKNS
jgi:hypothetical protein